MERIEQTKIEKEAKQLLDKFAIALEKVEHEHDLDFYVDREDFEREEVSSSWIASSVADATEEIENSKFADKSVINPDFKQKMLENAPNKDDDFIIAEKGSWK